MVRAPESVDALRVVPHCHDVAVFPGKEPRNVGLDAVRVLELIDHDVAVPGRYPVPYLIAVEGELQVDEQVVVVEAVVLSLVVPVLFLDGLYLGGQLIVVAVHLPDCGRRWSCPCWHTR